MSSPIRLVTPAGIRALCEPLNAVELEEMAQPLGRGCIALDIDPTVVSIEQAEQILQHLGEAIEQAKRQYIADSRHRLPAYAVDVTRDELEELGIVQLAGADAILGSAPAGLQADPSSTLGRSVDRIRDRRTEADQTEESDDA